MELTVLIPLVIQGLQAAISAAPGIAKVVTGAKDLIAGLFEGKVITAEQQTVLHDHVDSIVAMSKAGLLPSNWQVRPDPKS